MAKRFWLTASAPPYSPATARGTWAVASGFDQQYLGQHPAGTAGTSTINVGSTAANRDVLLHRSVSDGAVKAGTLSGTVQWVIGAKESATGLNGKIHLHIYVTSGDTDTPRGTLLSNFIGTATLPTTAQGTTEGAQTISAVTLSAGDRIVVEIGYRASATGTTQNASINYGNTGSADLTSGATTVTTAPGWVEFSGASGLFAKSFSTLTDDFSSGAFGTQWTASAGTSVTGARARVNCTTAYPSVKTAAAAYEIQSSQVAFRVPTLPTAGGGSNVNVSAYLWSGAATSTTNLEFNYKASTNQLILYNNVAGADPSPTTLTYDPAAHLWWRYREAAGSIYMETSPDNTTWTARRTITPSQWMLHGDLTWYFEAGRDTGTADYAEFDDVNVTTTPTSKVKVWDGVAWNLKPAKTWNGSAWVTKPAKTWNGTTWI